MKFEPARTNHPGKTASWTTEGDHYSILASDQKISLLFRPPGADCMQFMPTCIFIGDRGITAFVVRGIMDALEPIPDDPELTKAQAAVQAYLEQLCPEEDRYRQAEGHESEYLKLGDINIQVSPGERYICYVRRDHIRRYMKDNADRSQSKTER